MDRKTFRRLSLKDIFILIPCNVAWSVPATADNFWVFWSAETDELFYFFQSLFPDVADTFVDNGDIKSKILELFRWLRFGTSRYQCLLQFWAPVQIEENIYLSVADQPFALNCLHEGLCKYRLQCLNFLLPVEATSANKEAYLGPPGRMFQHGLPEYCMDVSHYKEEEFPLRDYAVECGVREYMVMPIFEPDGRQCVGILELAGTKQSYIRHIVEKLTPKITELNLTSPDVSDTDICSDEGRGKELEEIHRVLIVLCRTYELPCGQIWFAGSPAADCLKRAQEKYFWRSLDGIVFVQACEGVHLQKGHGVAGKAFSSLGACFCKNVSQLSVSDYCLVPSARKLGLTGCFAIALQNIHTRNDIYVLEFFKGIEEIDDPRSTLSEILRKLRQELLSFRVANGQELGEKLFVQVLRISPDDELDSFEICHNLASVSAFNESEMMQDDAYATTNIDEQNEAAGSPSRVEINDQPNVLHNATDKGKQVLVDGYPFGPEFLLATLVQSASSSSGWWPHQASREYGPLNGETRIARLEPRLEECNIDDANERLGTNQHPNFVNVATAVGPLSRTLMLSAPSSSGSLPHQASREFYAITRATSTAGLERTLEEFHNYNAFQSLEVQEQSNAVKTAATKSAQENEVAGSSNSIGASPPFGESVSDLFAQVDGLGTTRSTAMLEQNFEAYNTADANELGNQETAMKLEGQHTDITRDDLLKCFGKMKLQDAAKYHGVSRSTFKRLCRKQNIKRWQSRKRKPESLPDLEELNRIANNNVEATDQRTHNALTVEDDSSIMVKASFANDIAKFRVSVSSTKKDLGLEVAKRFNLSIQGMKIKYLDEENNWVLIGCDEDWWSALGVLRSLGKNTMEITICPSD